MAPSRAFSFTQILKNALGLINDIALPLTPFGEKITNLDVVLICID